MTLNQNAAQMRELNELRNHLKWLDEERRKSTRKMSELEQRLAQQGRELTERDQKIVELERYVADFNQRFERMPDVLAGTPDTEQRLQDLEWHISSMNTMLSRLPSPDDEQKRRLEEQTYLQDEIARAINATHERVESSQSLLEARLHSEITAVRDSDNQQPLVVQLEQQAEEIATLRGAVFDLSGRLQETAESLAADSQSSLNTLAQNVQNHLDTTLSKNSSQLDALIADNRKQWDDFTAREAQLRSEVAAVRDSDNQQPLVVQLEQQAEEIATLRGSVFDLSGRLQETAESLAADSQSSINTLAQSVQNHLDTMLGENSSRLNALSSEIDLKLAELPNRKLDEIVGLQQTWESRLDNLEQNISKLGHLRELMPVVDRHEQELELRQAEELRLSNLLTAQEERFTPLSAMVEDLGITNTTLNNRLIDSEKTIQELLAQVRDINDNLKPAVDDTYRRLSPLAEKVALLTNSAMKSEAGLQAISSDQAEFRETVVGTTDELQRQQKEATRQLESWQATMDENKDTIERFTQQWITLSNQYKEARMAVQNFAHWQKQLEQQKREASEMLRLESNRMQGRWDGFLLEVQEKLKNFEIDFGQKWQTFELDNEQKWSASRRSEKLWREEISAVDELIQKLQQDNRNLIWRVQNAQADAIKKWPRILMEEVEKAVEINPNRRLTSITTPPSGEMSVVDAIEQGLITIDYNDDTDDDN